MAKYVAVIHKERDSDYGVSFPDFPGCITAGETIDEAANMAQEALTGHVEWMRREGDAIPAASSLESIEQSDAARDMVAFLMVDVPVVSTRAVRVNITIDEDVLYQLDSALEERGIPRSRYITDLIRSDNSLLQ